VVVGGRLLSQARVSVVSLKRPLIAGQLSEPEVLLDRIVRPTGKVLDLRTRISGITQQMLDSPDGFGSLAEVQAALLELVTEDCVLVGHGLCHDLRVLKLHHTAVIDTSLVYASPLKHQLVGLRDVVKHVFKRDCQPEGEPHNSVVDAAWPLELVRHGVDACQEVGAGGDKQQQARILALNGLVKIPLPEHLKHRIQVMQIPLGADRSDVVRALKIPHAVKWSGGQINFKAKDAQSAKMGSIVIKFAKEAEATAIFQALSLEGMKQDKDKLWQKKLFLAKSKFPDARHFYAKAYCGPGAGPPSTGGSEPTTPGASAGRTVRTPRSSGARGKRGAAALTATTPGGTVCAKFCPGCGTAVAVADSKFCMQCGNSLVIG
jgi:DNA polymerase III epsilon subunit-like protein